MAPQRILKSGELWCILGLWIGMQCLFGTSFPYDYDSVNFALALVDRFDPSRHQPQPPGYFFHVTFGRLARLVVENPFRAQQLQNLIYLMLVVATLARTPATPGMRLFLCTLPLLLFFTAAPVASGALAGFSALLYRHTALMMDRKGTPTMVVAAYALAIGFRQDLSLFLLPLVAYGLWRYRPSLRQVVRMAAVFCSVTALWLVPTWLASSHLPFLSTGHTFRTFAAGSSIFFGAPPTEAVRWAFRFMVYGTAVFGPAGIFYVIWCLIKAPHKQTLMLGLAALPSLLSGLLLHGPKPGYWAIALGVFAAWSCSMVRPTWRFRTWMVMAAVNILFFLTVPPVHELQTLSGNAGSMNRRIARQLAFVGANGRQELNGVRRTFVRLDEKVARCDCFYLTDGSVGSRALDYMARHVWRNTMEHHPDPGCCNGNAAAGDR
ncbi:MAG: hypothetical protein JW768_03955 [Chitinispirillaceae bacterium]|nr:hypothetical protein [Chitinispirillaceae bacterium]